MPPIEFDVDSARAAKRELDDIYSELQADINKLTKEVEYVKIFWQARSADEFYGIFEDIRSNVNNTLEPLVNLSSRLGTEISQWEEADKAFG